MESRSRWPLPDPQQICGVCGGENVVSRRVRAMDLEKFLAGQPVKYPEDNDACVHIAVCDDCKSAFDGRRWREL